ncbi:MAG TPA: N-acetylneuraminate synthase family protein [Ignavibacteriaceae bacterium]|jgi:N-acetylneuraminate synthase|nr:MAG: N,N'-diacetyllegionaminic acid synthase [Ignavibacteria bacterium ADurb.Bin266]OQY75547.1 MAG: N-acetylneuraminate synthase [Ignavibacteriales bacterium UTCHB2]HQF42266.1 N-acetylneuraminate synthase family protein [Ignavibacteriaceae bacterium]HQI41800.1 N-acetylneuraminate synthase family protein [Ignavibacteriaceae bacterium]HQJ45733.1 N-acetylneuraminate synthase family protein [Ignavibacteriaceae bacterium]
MSKREIKIKDRFIGDGHPVFVIGEIGINHNGDVEIAKKIIAGAKHAGVDAVKFQKRTPEICVHKDQWNIERDTPWGRMTYIDYRYKVEFNEEQYTEIDRYCKEIGITWFASCWDEPAVDFIEKFDPPLYKTASASLTDFSLLEKVNKLNKPVIMSTGMSTMEEIEKAVSEMNKNNLMIAHATSAYPCKNEELNLKMIETLKNKYSDIPIGYSGHEVGLAPTWAAVALGACFVERHITLDRAMWGTDQAASVEINGIERLISSIRDIELALGDGIKKVYDSELYQIKKLRRIK